MWPTACLVKEGKKKMANDMGDKKFFDVSKPGKVPAEATSRPVIVTNRSMVKDPTLKHAEATAVETAADKEQPEEDKKLISSSAKTIEPISDNLKQEKSKEVPKNEEPVKDTAKNDQSEVPPEQKAEDDTSQKQELPDNVNTNKDKDTPDNDQVELGRAEQKKKAELTEAQKAQKEKIDKLILDGKYFVPTGHIKRNRKVRKVLIASLIVLLLGLIAADLLVDAGIIKTSIKPPIDLIENL